MSPESDPDAPFNVSDSLAPPRVNKSAGTTTTTFDGLLKEPLLLKEDLKNGCGGQLWPAGMVLAKYLLCRHSSTLSDKTMLVFPKITSCCFPLSPAFHCLCETRTLMNNSAWSLEPGVDLSDSPLPVGADWDHHSTSPTNSPCSPL